MLRKLFISNNDLLVEAAEASDVMEVKRLLEKKANIDSKDDKNGQTPLIKAINAKHNTIVDILLDKKANIHKTDYEQNTPLHWAARVGSSATVQKLLDRKASLEQRNEKEFTPLLNSTWYARNLPTVDLLLQAKANVNVQDCKGYSPLFIATVCCSLPLMEKLLKVEEIDLSLKTKGNRLEESETALSYAKRLNWQPGMAALEAKMNEHKHHSNNTFAERLKKIGYEGNIPAHLTCPISLEILNDPITVSSGATYDRQTLKNYFASHGNPLALKCPMIRSEIQLQQLFSQSTTWVVKDLLEAFVRSKEEEFKATNKDSLAEEPTVLSNLSIA